MTLKTEKKIYIIRFIGYFLLLILAIDIIFFKHSYISKTFLGNGLSAGIAVIMSQYKVNYKEKTLKETLFIIISILLISLTLYYFWYK